MKILMVNKFLYRKGGSESYMFDLAKKLTEEGHEIEYFGMEDEKNIVTSEYLVKNMDFYSNIFKKVTYSMKVIYSREARKKIKHCIEAFRPDIIHINNYNFQLTPSILFEIKKQGIRVVQTVHDTQMMCPNHSMFNSKRLEICEKCKDGKFYNCTLDRCIDNSLIKSIIGSMESYFYNVLGVYNRLIDIYICPSEFIQRKLIDYGLQEDKTIVITNFIKQRPDAQISKKGNYVLYFGRLSREKCIDTLLRVVKETPNIHYVFAGKGPLEDRLKKYKNIEYLGFVSGSELSDIIRKANVTLCIGYENSPMSVLESQMYGTPVIGSNLGGVKELIVEGRTGFLLNPKNEKKLKEYIEKMINDKNLAEEFGKNSLEHVNKFNIDKYTDILFDKVYKC